MLTDLIPYLLSANRMCSLQKVCSHDKVQNESMDDGVLIYFQQDTYVFEDGKVLRCEREIDDVVSEAMCPECWIDYVLYADAQFDVVLARKSFISFCQEGFWLKRQYHQLFDDEK